MSGDPSAAALELILASPFFWALIRPGRLLWNVNTQRAHEWFPQSPVTPDELQNLKNKPTPHPPTGQMIILRKSGYVNVTRMLLGGGAWKPYQKWTKFDFPCSRKDPETWHTFIKHLHRCAVSPTGRLQSSIWPGGCEVTSDPSDPWEHEHLFATVDFQGHYVKPQTKESQWPFDVKLGSTIQSVNTFLIQMMMMMIGLLFIIFPGSHLCNKSGRRANRFTFKLFFFLSGRIQSTANTSLFLDSGNWGGICSQYTTLHNGPMSTLNTGLITIQNYGEILPPRLVALTVAHELGHSLGSPVSYHSSYISKVKLSCHLDWTWVGKRTKKWFWTLYLCASLGIKKQTLVGAFRAWMFALHRTICE